MEIDICYRGVGYAVDIEFEDDNIKRLHYIVDLSGTSPRTQCLDYDVYAMMNYETFQMLVDICLTLGHLPKRKTCNPLNKQEVFDWHNELKFKGKLK